MPEPRIFGVPLGADFPAALIGGLDARMGLRDPAALARTEIWVNTRRMARRLRDLYDAGPPRLLPRIRLLTDLGDDPEAAAVPPAIPPLRRRLDVIGLISKLLDRQPDLAPRASLYDLADSLVALNEEMQGEGVDPAALAALDVSDASGHWARSLAFLTIVQDYFDQSDGMDAEARQRQIVAHKIQSWAQCPPDHPIVLAGSTGSRGTTQMLMQAVAQLPKGAVVLPGFDFDLPGDVWRDLRDAPGAEDHPQFRFVRLCQALNLPKSAVTRWDPSAQPSHPARNRLISLSLRPAPVTDQWLREGPDLADLDGATRDLTLVEADTPRQEALTIALRLRKAAEDGQTAALITPDRVLTRRVTAALDRWGIVPDDSAGLPLHLSAPGRFLRHVADLRHRRLTTEALLTLLKHPLTHSGTGRNDHLRRSRDLELALRARAIPFPDAAALDLCLPEDAGDWGTWLRQMCVNRTADGPAALADHVSHHIALAEDIAAGPAEGRSEANASGDLWQQAPGRAALAAVDALRAEAAHGTDLSASDYADMFAAILAREVIRDRDAPHPGILIWGTLEARVQGADLLILGGLNEGSWPQVPAPDPWLNRRMRQDAGLLLPERRIGLSAHDYEQAVAACEVWLTRSTKTEEAETVPARWINRLCNLLDGLPGADGATALRAMRQRGQSWLRMAELGETPIPAAPAPRPAPCPPASARPHRLSVTEIKRLRRDPYAIYAKHVLRLKPLQPVDRQPDALLRGIALHKAIETFVRDGLGAPDHMTAKALLAHTASALAATPWLATRALWQARAGRIAEWFVTTEAARQSQARPIAFECKARAELPELGFVLTGTADRIDQAADGQYVIYDYKSGALPSKDQQRVFDKQLLLEAAMAEHGAFHDLPPAPVAAARFIGLGNPPREMDAPLNEEPVDVVWAKFTKLIGHMLDPGSGFTARRAMEQSEDTGDYDQLARFGEWTVAMPAAREPVG